MKGGTHIVRPVLLGLLLSLLMAGCVPDRYRQWCRENRELVARLHGLSAEHDWRLLVVAWDGENAMIARLNLSNDTWSAVYRSDDVILGAGMIGNSNLAILEAALTASHGRRPRNSYKVTIVEVRSGGVTQTIPVPEEDLPGAVSLVAYNELQAPPEPLVAGRGYVVFGAGNHAVRYDLEESTSHVLYSAPAEMRLRKARGAPGYFALLFCETSYIGTDDSSRLWSKASARNRLAIVSVHPPHDVIAELTGIQDYVLCGEDLVVEKEGLIVDYDVHGDEFHELAEGRLLCATDAQRVAYVGHDEAEPGVSLLRLLDIRLRQDRAVAALPDGFPELDEPAIGYPDADSPPRLHEPLQAFPDPEGEYVFVKIASGGLPQHWRSEYRVYRLSPGEETGAIYHYPYAGGRLYCHTVLGWDVGLQNRESGESGDTIPVSRLPAQRPMSRHAR